MLDDSCFSYRGTKSRRLLHGQRREIQKDEYPSPSSIAMTFRVAISENLFVYTGARASAAPRRPLTQSYLVTY